MDAMGIEPKLGSHHFCFFEDFDPKCFFLTDWPKCCILGVNVRSNLWSRIAFESHVRSTPEEKEEVKEFVQGLLNGTDFEGIKQYKSMVNLRDSP